MKWNKLGLQFCPNGQHPWMVTHAANPVVEQISDGRLRVYFNSRDEQHRSYAGAYEFDISQPFSIRLAPEPVLSPGPAGLFDDSGASLGCLVRHDSLSYMYYVGWNLGVTVPWRNSIGLAIRSAGDGLFSKYAQAPIVDRSSIDPFSLSYPWVLRDGDLWRMWYGSNLNWGTGAGPMEHVIKYAESSDGIHWQRNGLVAIGLGEHGEHAISRPCVLKDGGVYRMWYSFRGPAYRIGYAESHNGIDWVRQDDQVGIDVSTAGWDSEMIEYACVFDCEGSRYMLYNGNGYGLTGVGLAVLD